MADWRVDSDSSESSISYGQSLLSKAKKKRKKREKKAKIAKYTALGLGIGDAILAKKANKQIDYLKEEEVFDLNQRKSDWGDKISFEALYDTIYQKGFNPSKEESYRNYFYDQAATAYNSSNVDKELHPEKDAWIDIEMGNRIKDWKDNLKNWKPWLRATEAEFSQPIADYYKQQVRNVLRPGNTSTVRKVLQKFGLWEDSEIKLTFENGHYAGALRNTKSVDDAYTLAMKNTKDRLEILRGDRPSDTQYEDLPAINKIIKLSKSVNRNMQQQIADSFLADKSGMFFGQSLTLNPENLPAGISPQSAQGEQILRMQALIGKAPTDDSQATGNIFHDTFYKFATRAKQGDEGYDPEKPGLGWTEGEWKNWFNNSDRGKENFQDLLYHRLAGPEATNNLREHFAEEFGGQWTTTGASHMFMLVWGRRAQNLFDIEKRSKGLPLTQGANPADWSPYIEQAFRETVQNDLVLRDDGRLEVVETSAVALLAPDSLGPKPFVEEVDETLVPDTQKPTPTITTTTPPDTPTPPTPVSEELQETIELIRNESVVTRDELELNGPSAVIYNSLDEGTSIKDIKNQIIELSEYFPEEKERMNDVLIDYQEKLIEDLARGVTTTDTTEQQVTLTPQQEGERLASKGRDQIGLAEGIGNAWRNRIEKERRQRLEWRLSGERSVGDNQFARDLKNAGLSENASSREIRDYLYGEEEDILMAAE